MEKNHSYFVGITIPQVENQLFKFNNIEIQYILVYIDKNWIVDTVEIIDIGTIEFYGKIYGIVEDLPIRKLSKSLEELGINVWETASSECQSITLTYVDSLIKQLNKLKL